MAVYGYVGLCMVMYGQLTGNHYMMLTPRTYPNGRLHPAVIHSNNRASRPPSWYLLQCEASQLEAEMSDEENENNTDIDRY